MYLSVFMVVRMFCMYTSAGQKAFLIYHLDIYIVSYESEIRLETVQNLAEVQLQLA